MPLSPNIKIWLSSEEDEGVFGGGKYRLLKAIHEQGSLSAAAKELSISYRKAWGDLKKAERCLGRKLIDKSRGGSGGGNTTLTPYGLELIKGYSAFVEQVTEQVDLAYTKTLKDLMDD